MATKICQYEKGCKNWVVTPNGDDDEPALCPVHRGVVEMNKPRELSDFEKATKQRFEMHVMNADAMTNDQLANHILQLQSLLEDVKLRQQAASHVKSKRLQLVGENGSLTDAQRDEIAKLRGKPTFKPQEPKISKEEKEIQKMMKLGLTREKAMKMLGLGED